MKAVCWIGKHKIETLTVPDPANSESARCDFAGHADGDLWVGPASVRRVHSDDGGRRYSRPRIHGCSGRGGRGSKEFEAWRPRSGAVTIACGNCEFCRKQIWAACDNTNPNAHLMEAAYGYSGSGLFGYSHLMGGYAGGQAQYVRVPFANVGPLKIESDLPDEKVLFLSDIFPTGYMAAENAQIQPSDTVAVWGCGPGGAIFAIASAFMLGAARVIAIDRLPERLEMARSRAITVDYSEEDVSVLTALKDLTGGIGPDSCIDAVGLEAHSTATAGHL